VDGVAVHKRLQRSHSVDLVVSNNQPIESETLFDDKTGPGDPVSDAKISRKSEFLVENADNGGN